MKLSGQGDNQIFPPFSSLQLKNILKVVVLKKQNTAKTEKKSQELCSRQYGRQESLNHCPDEKQVKKSDKI